MKICRTIIPFSLLLFFFSINNLLGQAKENTVDPAFEAYMDNARTKIEQAGLSDSRQNQYASEFFGYYLNHPETETGMEALQQAFGIWGDTGAAEEVEEAVAKISNDAEIWSNILLSIRDAYFKHERTQDYIDLLARLKNRLTHPVSKSAVLYRLANALHDQREFTETTKIAHEIINLNAYEFHVVKAKGLLYEMENLRVGQKAPDFTAKTIDGETIDLSDLEGKVVLLDFWASWCGPCLADIPHFQSIRATYAEDELHIIGISLDRNLEALNEFLKEEKMDWPHVFQPEGWTGELIKLYNVTSIPDTYLINRKGIIVAKDLGGKELEKKIAELLNN